MKSLVILNLSGTNLAPQAFHGLIFYSLQFLNLSSTSLATITFLTTSTFPTLKELVLSHLPLSPTTTTASPHPLPPTLRLLDLSYSFLRNTNTSHQPPSLLSTLKALVAPHASLLVLDISQGSRAEAQMVQQGGLIALKTWFPRVQHVVADG